MLTLVHPLPPDVSVSKNSLAKKLSKSSSVFESGVIFKGAENSGGNALGALYPILHLTPHTTEARRLANTINTATGPLAISQAVYTELDTVDVAGEQERYDTNSIILVGCKVVSSIWSPPSHHNSLSADTGGRVPGCGGSGDQLEVLDQHWSPGGSPPDCRDNLTISPPLGTDHSLSLQAEIKVQNLQFLKQMVPADPHIFMYCILVNIQLSGEAEETRVLAGLQRMRGSVVAGYTALYTVTGSLARSSSEDSMERLIMNVSRGQDR